MNAREQSTIHFSELPASLPDSLFRTEWELYRGRWAG